MTSNKIEKLKFLDCTLRDGGYYTNWDFPEELTQTYFEAFNSLPADYLEIGYRSIEKEGYLGKYFYCPSYMVKKIKEVSNKKLVIILNEKDIRVEHLNHVLSPVKGLIDMVRMAISPDNFERALGLGRAIKAMGFEVSFNIMYMSKWKEQKGLIEGFGALDGLADYLYLVDSYGSVYPKDVMELFELVRAQTNVKLGYHGHNNLELGLINTLTAIECGADIVDATITGMGRGAGNLKTELFLTVLNEKYDVEFEFNTLSKVVEEFEKLREHYRWGTNLPYMVSGAHSLPQKEVMEWVGKRYFSFNSIIRALTNKSKGVKDNTQLDSLDFNKVNKCKKALIVGGGPNAVLHAEALIKFLEINPEMAIIHASSKNASVFKNISNEQYFCLVGNEGYRMEDVLGKATLKGKGIMPPYPRKMGTYVPTALKANIYELEKIDFTDLHQDSHTSIALQTAKELGVDELFITGYDGYSEAIGQKEQELFLENQYLFTQIQSSGIKCHCITPSTYSNLVEKSIYTLL